MNIMAHDAIFSVISKEILVPIPEESTADETNDETVSLGTSSNASVVSALSWPEYALDDVNFFLICCAGAVWFASYFISVAKIFLGISIFVYIRDPKHLSYFYQKFCPEGNALEQYYSKAQSVGSSFLYQLNIVLKDMLLRADEDTKSRLAIDAVENYLNQFIQQREEQDSIKKLSENPATETENFDEPGDTNCKDDSVDYAEERDKKNEKVAVPSKPTWINGGDIDKPLLVLGVVAAMGVGAIHLLTSGKRR